MIRRLTAVASLLFVSSAAFASPAIDAANNQVRASVVQQKFDYVEYDAFNVTHDGILDSERGNQTGIAAGISLQRDIANVKNIYFNIEAARLTGDTGYDGYLQGGPVLIPYQTTTQYDSTDIQVKIGQGFKFGAHNDAQVTPYVSFGSYKWVRDSSADPYGYAEDYRHKFAGIGTMLQYELSPRIVVKADYLYGRTFDASMTLVADSTEFALPKKPIQQLTLGLDYAVNKNVSVHADYRYAKFAYGQSDVINGFLEPASDTKRSQLAVGVGYRF